MPEHTEQATEEQAAVIPTQVGMRMVHTSTIQLRVDAVSLALTAHGSERAFGPRSKGDDGKVDHDGADAALLTTARKIHAFLESTQDGAP